MQDYWKDQAPLQMHETEAVSSLTLAQMVVAKKHLKGLVEKAC